MLDIDDDAFNAWKHHPVTKVYLRFLSDYEEAVRREIAQIIVMGAEAPPQFDLGILKGRCLAAREMATLSHGHIAAFYAPPYKEEE
jgi:hypothetical protein